MIMTKLIGPVLGEPSWRTDHDPEGLSGKLRKGVVIAATLLFGVGGFAAFTEISGAIVAQGLVVVDSNVKKVQHLTGGIVGELRVKDGDRVEAGDLVLRLDDTITRANHQIIVRQLDELAARQARLTAERDAEKSIVIPPSLSARQQDPEVGRLIDSERRLFESRRAARDGQKAMLQERITQQKEEIVGITAQRLAKSREIELVQVELNGQNDLWAKKLIAITKHTATQREAVRITGEHGQLTAQTAQIKGKIAETSLQIQQIDQDLRSEVMRDLREAQGKDAELQERRVAAEDQLRRVDIRSPQAGIVHQLAVHTVGGVIQQSEPIMLIVPQGDPLVIEARIAQNDIAQVQIGQPAYIRFSAFNQRTTPEFEGTITRIAADLSRDQQANAAYFTARIALNSGEISKLAGLKLVPGMPAEVHVRTGDRTILSYLMKPLQDQFALAFKER